jgi:hypothetical protein
MSPNPPAPSIEQWIAHLRHVAGAPDPSVELGAGDLDAPLRAAVCGAPASSPASPGGEIGLWWARTQPSIDVDALIAAPTDGSLLPRDAYRAIEVWTDADLSAIHALWWLAMERGRDDWRERVDAVRRWHLENTQPDNATNRPWALHVFLLGPEAESRHYAETLLHNCLAVHARPDTLSALILLDAAKALERRTS